MCQPSLQGQGKLKQLTEQCFCFFSFGLVLFQSFGSPRRPWTHNHLAWPLPASCCSCWLQVNANTPFPLRKSQPRLTTGPGYFRFPSETALRDSCCFCVLPVSVDVLPESTRGFFLDSVTYIGLKPHQSSCLTLPVLGSQAQATMPSYSLICVLCVQGRTEVMLRVFLNPCLTYCWSGSFTEPRACWCS